MFGRFQTWVALLCIALFGTSCRPTALDDDDDTIQPVSAFERVEIDDDWQAAGQGPWGIMEYRRFFLPIPREWLRNGAKSEPAVWDIPGFTPDKVAQVIAASPLSEEEQRLWKETCRLEGYSQGTKVHPSKEFRWALKPESRAMLYVWLSQFPQNNPQVFPFCYDASRVDEWMRFHQLDAELTVKLRQLMYRVGGSACFADLDLIDELVTDDEQRADLLSIIYRRPYCQVRIKLDQKTDLNALSTYWGEWHRKERVKRKFKEELGTKPEAYITLANILPPLPRSLLNTYPALPKDPQAVPPDCFWTAFNFFNRSPDNRFNDTAFMQEALTKYHDRVEGKRMYGDLIFLVDNAGGPMHAAVYLADDFVFTKNGGHFTQPWVIMKLAEMKNCYPQMTPVREATYRWNPQKARPKSS